MLEYLKNEANRTVTENGAATYASTGSHCLDLFAAIGAVRAQTEQEIMHRFLQAYTENADTAMKLLFYGRDVRGGLGERRVFRVILWQLAQQEPDSVRKNLALIPEYGRYDDLLVLLDTPCEADLLAFIRRQLQADLAADENVSLLAKWLPSVNTSSRETVRMAKKIAGYLGMTDRDYRKMLSALRQKIRILENSLREKDYTFDYAKQPSKAMFKYRKAFLRNDGRRYSAWLDAVSRGEAAMHTGVLAPYEIIAPCFGRWGTVCTMEESERRAMDVTWNALEDFGSDENAIVVVDGSGSMYCRSNPIPEAVALSLGIYFAEHNRGVFRDHFITFSQSPRLVEIKGRDIAEKVRYCASFNEVANTDLQQVFRLILNTAVAHNVPQSELPSTVYIVSDMEFDCCTDRADQTNFKYAEQLFAQHGYRLPRVVFWNVASRGRQQPVTQNEQGVALVSGCTPRLFSMVASGAVSPYAVMMDIVTSERYAKINA